VSTIFGFLIKGGWVAYCLAMLSIVLWYALAYRYLFLNFTILKKSPENVINKTIESQDALSRLLLKINKINGSDITDKELAFTTLVKPFFMSLETQKQTIKSIVLIAPLLGLLGTVIGMIETFDSLQDSALFSQSGGVAGGISQALITTQLGLVVAIPGLLVGRRLDRKQDEINGYVDHFIELNKLEGSPL
jgi:biopolymer transport protein ExbB